MKRQRRLLFHFPPYAERYTRKWNGKEDYFFHFLTFPQVSQQPIRGLGVIHEQDDTDKPTKRQSKTSPLKNINQKKKKKKKKKPTNTKHAVFLFTLILVPSAPKPVAADNSPKNPTTLHITTVFLSIASLSRF
jgi:hypothetical protein